MGWLSSPWFRWGMVALSLVLTVVTFGKKSPLLALAITAAVTGAAISGMVIGGLAGHNGDGWCWDAAADGALMGAQIAVAVVAVFGIGKAIAFKVKFNAAVKAKNYAALAKMFTHNKKAKAVMLGKSAGGGPAGYVAMAKKGKHTYFAMKHKTWNKLEVAFGQDNMWLINQSFIDQQVLLGKKFMTSHPVIGEPVGTFFGREIQRLIFWNIFL